MGDAGDLGFICCNYRAGDHEGSGPGHGATGGGGDDEWGAVRVGFERVGMIAGGCVTAIKRSPRYAGVNYCEWI